MRAIDADRLLEERRIHTYYHLPNGDIAIPLIDIKNAPTIEPERKKGHWIEDNEGYFYCDQCGKYPAYQITQSACCPNCGADMREDGEADDKT